MGLSGDIYDMSEHQWDVIHAGMDFYNNASDIIKNGYTEVLDCNTSGYNEPDGGQLVVRSFDNKVLVVYHRFENSVSLSEYVRSRIEFGSIKESRITDMLLKLGRGPADIVRIDTYGSAESDFSAQAWIVKN